MSKLLEVVELLKQFELHIQEHKTIRSLDGISFTLEQGEVLALTGRSGSGKSSLMKCIYRTYIPTSGHIFYSDAKGICTDLATAPVHDILSLRKHDMTYCSQFLQVIPRVAAKDIVAAGLISRGVSSEEAMYRTRECFQRLSLPQQLWDGYPITFSGGEQQRVNIARAIISRPRLLLIDEPTASLDSGTRATVLEMLSELKMNGTSIILITHDQFVIDRVADRQLDLEHRVNQYSATA